ncbi:hypothetical protein Forpi1262_v018256 [Fusarium oxysporum f. sp. raphani]|uniref:Uncharacterized protein n=1 Tax=Fusarium oxysporum f. sp. raphani TaxID=96318 RepID=A0A8J5NL88_FUSOX|nr:hypothetical protein Forpi1262_v018256 [Fusarium oxysporum f. sp. raphani]
MLRERVECLIVHTQKKSSTEVFSPADRESCTVIGTGNAAGDTTPPWLIFKSFPTLEWAQIEGDFQMRFAQSDTAFSNAEIMLQWAQHFNRHSWEKSATVQRRQLDFEQYFGCNEHLQQPGNAFREYDLPPNAETIAEEGPEIFNEGFTAAHIISGFEKSGIFPPTDRPAVEYLLRKKLKTKKTVDPAFFSLLPSETRFSTASATAQHVRDRYHDILSSPTRQGLKHIQNIVHEAILLEDHIKRHVEGRRARIEKRYHERKRGKRARGASGYINTISLQELREQQDEYVTESQKKSIRSEIRQQRSQLIRELEALKQEWRDNREVTVEGITKKLQFKKWLEVTGKKNDYLSMDTQRSAMTEALNEVTDGFMIDTQHPADLRESIRNASFAAKPLEAVDFSLLPHSDDSVTFHLTRPEETPCPSDFGSNSEVVMPSSPPCLPDYESPLQSPLPTALSTPCPSQHQIQYRESLRDLIQRERQVAEATVTGEGE